MTALKRLAGWVATLGATTLPSAALADQPHAWGVTMQTAVTPIMDQIVWFDGYTLIIITLVTLFVLALMAYVVWKFSAKRNPSPSKNSHNTLLEVVWTVVPVMILVAIAFPSFRLLYDQTTIPTPDITVKATGAQWYWIYDYMDEDLEALPQIYSNMLNDEDRAERKEQYGLDDSGVPRLLAVDYPLVVPEDAVVHVLATSNDVNHAVAVPAFGIKHDAIQGRINDSWFVAREPGVYYGQCSQLCGVRHAFMPLEVRVLTAERFDEWKALAADDLDKATEQLLTWQAGDAGQPVALLDMNSAAAR